MNNRKQICLNGLWDFCPGNGTLDRIPRKWDKTQIKVPSPWNINTFAGPEKLTYGKEKIFLRGGEFNLYPEYPKAWENAQSGWYKTEIFIDEEWRGKVITLKFNAVLFYSEFYINGKLISTDADGFLPHEFPVQDHVKYGGSNTLVVGVKKLDAFRYKNEAGKNRIEYPTGSFWGKTMGGIWQDVYLNVYPHDHITDIFVRTDVNSNILRVDADLAADRGENFTVGMVLRERSGDRSFKLACGLPVNGNSVEFIFDYSGIKDEIRQWWPDSPELYYIDVILHSGNEIVDVKTARFGFKSFEVRGKQFYLNGTPINLRNDSWHYMGFAYQNEEYARLWYKMARDANVNCIRLHAQVYPEFFLDMADEMGMMIVDETSIWASHCEFHYSMEFVENGKKHIKRMIERDRNHPSIIIWSVENECIMAYRVSADDGVKDENELNERLFLLAEYAGSLDPTRPVSGDGSQDMGGRLDVYSLHYPGKKGPENVNKPVTIGEMGSLYYATPDCVCNQYGEKTYLSFDGRLEAIGRELFENLKHERKWAAQVCVFNLVWYGLKPLPFKERIINYPDLSLPGVKPTRTGPYISTLNAGYDDSLPEYIPNTVFEWVRQAYLPERFFFEEGRSRYYNGEAGAKKISVFNDSFEEKEYILEWQMEQKGEILGSGNKSVLVNPAGYEELDIEFDLPAADSIERLSLRILMKFLDNIVFEDVCSIKVYNKNHIFSFMGGFGKVGILGGSRLDANEFFEKSGIETVDGLTQGIDIYLLEECTEEAAAGLTGACCSVLDLLPEKHGFKSWLSHGSAENAFLNVDDRALMENLEEEDLFNWGGGFLCSNTFQDNLCVSASNLFCTGKGIPLILEVKNGKAGQLVSTIPLLKWAAEEPAALVLLSNLIAYAAQTGKTVSHECVLVSKKDSDMHRSFEKMGIDFTLAEVKNRDQIKSLREVKLLVADGSCRLDYLDEIMPYNAEQILLCNFDEATLPDSLKGYIEVVEKPLYQLIKAGKDNALTDGIHAGDLYGLEAGQETVICKRPFLIRDDRKVKGLLKNADLNWRMWNFQGEDRKTVSILRSEQETKTPLYGLAETHINTVKVILGQIDMSYANRKLERLASRFFSNMGLTVNCKMSDEFENILHEGIYDGKVTKALVLSSKNNLEPESMSPEINRFEEAGAGFWRVLDLLDSDSVKNEPYCYYCLYIHSPSDRTDLLLNPDLMEVQIRNKHRKELYLNNTLISEGKQIALAALPLKNGWNKLVIKENREVNEAAPLSVVFRRKDSDNLDLQFSLESEGFQEIVGEQFQFITNSNQEMCDNITKGKGYFWESSETQVKGMYLQSDLKSVYEIAKLQFNSRMEDTSVRLNTPRSFVLLFSTDGKHWEEEYNVSDEEKLSFIDGKVILCFNKQKARYVKLVITNVALKPLSVSEFKVFGYGG